MDGWLSSFMALWLFGFAALWLCGFMALWPCGFVVLWLRGWLAGQVALGSLPVFTWPTQFLHLPVFLVALAGMSVAWLMADLKS